MVGVTPTNRARLRLGHLLDVSLPIYASMVLLVAWVFVGLAVFTDSAVPADTWAWFESLDLVPAVVAWLALLPIGVCLWAWQADLEPIWFGLLMVLLAGWTFIAWSGSVRALARRRRT
jgi:hypothetical protein